MGRGSDTRLIGRGPPGSWNGTPVENLGRTVPGVLCLLIKASEQNPLVWRGLQKSLVSSSISWVYGVTPSVPLPREVIFWTWSSTDGPLG